MFDIGFWEIIVIAIVALLVVGPERFPGMVKKAGYWFGQFRRIISTVKQEVQQEIDKADQLQNLIEEQKQIVERNTDVDLTQPAVKPQSVKEQEAKAAAGNENALSNSTSDSSQNRKDNIESSVQK